MDFTEQKTYKVRFFAKNRLMSYDINVNLIVNIFNVTQGTHDVM